MEERYQGRWNCNMIADYCWSLMRDVPYAVHKRLATKRKLQTYSKNGQVNQQASADRPVLSLLGLVRTQQLVVDPS